jgi:hypothetical protein
MKSQGYLQSVSALPRSPEPVVALQPPPVVPERAKPAQRESRGGSGIWWLLAVIVGLPLLLARVADNTQPQARPLEVRRALPAVPRALPLTPPVSTALANSGQLIRMPDGSIVEARFQGYLSSSAQLPPQGRFIGEEYSTGNTSWIWMTPAGANFPSWVDP